MNLISYDKYAFASFDLSNFTLWRVFYDLFILFILFICYAFYFYLYNNAKSNDISPRHVIYLPFNPITITIN